MSDIYSGGSSIGSPLAYHKAQTVPPKMILDEKIAINVLPNVTCPECHYQYDIHMATDSLRLAFLHAVNKCSRSNTKFYRPISIFTIFI